MSEARNHILGALKKALDHDGRNTEAVKQRIEDHHTNLIPQRGAGEREAQVARFTEEAEAVEATVSRIASADDLPAEVARYLSQANLPSAVRAAPSLQTVAWQNQPTLSVETGIAASSDTAGVSRAFGGVAETGTLVFLSGPDNPTTLNFVPPTHIAVLSTKDVAGDYESVWAKVRERKAGDPHFMPRTVNWITGPSRTGDIEQTLLLGAHGPQSLHIVLIDDPDG